MKLDEEFKFRKRHPSPDAGLRPLLRKHLPRFHWTTVETGAATMGVPDSNYCLDGIEGWVECKQCEHWRVELRPAQVGWIEQHTAAGGRVFIAVRRAKDELWLFAGCIVKRLTAERLDQVTCLNHWNGGPSRWDWSQVQHLLLA